VIIRSFWACFRKFFAYTYHTALEKLEFQQLMPELEGVEEDNSGSCR
jgi:hypothetical protein